VSKGVKFYDNSRIFIRLLLKR